jgi:hypothetical protein
MSRNPIAVEISCAACGLQAPGGKRGFSLIAGEKGWRMIATRDPAAPIVQEWFCPECWEKRRHSLNPK